MNTVDTQSPTFFGTSWLPSSGRLVSVTVVSFELVRKVRHSQ